MKTFFEVLYSNDEEWKDFESFKMSPDGEKKI